jgi:hypothetical protein
VPEYANNLHIDHSINGGHWYHEPHHQLSDLPASRYYKPIIAGSCNLINVGYPQTGSALVPFTWNFGTTPQIVIGVYIWQSVAQQIISFISHTTNINLSSFTLSYQIGGSSTIQEQWYYYLAVDGSITTDFMMLPSINYMGDCKSCHQFRHQYIVCN